MADGAADPAFLDIVNRLKAVEKAVEATSGDKEILQIDGRTKRRLEAELAALKAKIATLDDLDDSDRSDNSEDRTDASSEIEPIVTRIVPRLNRVDWTQFMNSTVGENQYTIDVLIGQIKSHWHRLQEERDVPEAAPDEQKTEQCLSSLTTSLPAGSSSSGTPLATHERSEASPEVPERIRINCVKLLETLRDVTGASGLVDVTDESVVLLRPYKLLIRHDKALRERFVELGAQYDRLVRETVQQQQFPVERSQPDATDGQENPEIDASTFQKDQPAPPTNTEEKETELQGLKCLLEFMDTYLMPVYQRYRSNTSKKIRFRDLWYLYRPGDIVVSRMDDKSHKLGQKTSFSSPMGGLPAIWRVASAYRGRPKLDSFHGPVSAIRPPIPEHNDFRVKVYAIAFDGTTYGPVKKKFKIAPFDGEREISTLKPYPARYFEDYANVEAQLIERGKRFVHYTKPTHCRYAGPTFSEHRSGVPCRVAETNTSIDGHVVVDFKEAERESMDWVLTHELSRAGKGDESESLEDFPRSIWWDKTRRDLRRKDSDKILDDESVNKEDWDDFIASNTFLAAYKRSPYDRFDHESFEPMDYALLPDRVVGYDLYRHKFAILALDRLESVRANADGWADLKLPAGHKSMVQAQIRTHFLRKQSRENHAAENADIDLVRGKGLGLIILLHGAPGVGKTSTAECVAESLGKPLYPITCGDLGVTAETVEATLARTFAKAEAWDCVLLLDEADVFLAQRTRTDLVRNAIVSVFLRVLEYYKGTLILTTNRVGAFDEAFKSRIHLNLYYPALDEGQTRDIWEMNMRRIIKRKQGRLTADEQEIMHFAGCLFREQVESGTRWNGRQIRNAFQTALAMAEFEALGEDAPTAGWELLEKVHSRLRVKHFETVAKASFEFDSYIELTIGSTDAKRAFVDRERADHFRWTTPINPRNEQRNVQWSHRTSGPHDVPYQQAGPDPFAPPSVFQDAGFYASQEKISVHAPYQQGQAWTSPQQPRTGMGSSPARPPQDLDEPQTYLLRTAESTAWPYKQNHGEYRPSNLAHSHFDGGRQQPPLTPSNRNQRPAASTYVGLGASRGQDDDGF